ncbi:hypothetical protein FQA39_LY03049 [Lamprigera yunnana]|nr:hypothetical protein FQA39_LY03049 [Lamprigera yunnana]
MLASLDKWKGKVAVVAGASGGIGTAITRKLLEAEIIVVGLGRNNEKIEALFSAEIENRRLFAIKIDITLESEVVCTFEWISKNVGPIHILVNSAGTLSFSSLIGANAQVLRDTMDTNVYGLCLAAREACKNMQENSVDGHIINMNSYSGHKVVCYPNLNLYPASKFAVTALTETLRQELNSVGSKIRVTSISPSGVRTPLIESARNAHEEGSTNDFTMLLPEDVADAVLYVLSTPVHVQIHELILHAVNDPV